MKIEKECGVDRRERIRLWKATATKVKRDKTVFRRKEKHKKGSSHDGGAPFFYARQAFAMDVVPPAVLGRRIGTGAGE